MDLDEDIIMTNNHMAEAEKKIGRWDYKTLQSESDMFESAQLMNLQKQH